MGLKIEREKAALMHVNKKSATLMRATKASDKSRSILEVSDEKVSESKCCGQSTVQECVQEDQEDEGK